MFLIVPDQSSMRSSSLFLLKSIINVDSNDQIQKVIKQLKRLKKRFKNKSMIIKNMDEVIEMLGRKICPLDAQSIISWFSMRYHLLHDA